MSDTSETRIESDSMGQVRVPASAYYGAQTQRAVENFPISSRRFPRGFIRALGLVKLAAARENLALGDLDEDTAEAIEKAAREVVDGAHDDQFVIDIFQTGSGTSTNMNANEVIANRATEIRGGQRGSKLVHPNDHVNRGQSSNDVIPTAIRIAALESIDQVLLPGLRRLHGALADKAAELDDVVKIGRTHLQDATPVRLGQEFAGYARQLERGIERVESSRGSLRELPLGGTAVGTGLNTRPGFAAAVIARIAGETDLELREAVQHFEAQASQDALVECSGALKTVATSVLKVANDIRLLGSGPRCGLGELRLPPVAPGSSIMPGKVNPVIAEAAVQAAAQVTANDLAVTLGGQWGFFELNTMLPLMASNLLESIEILGHSTAVLAERCVEGLDADRERAGEMVERSLAMVTALAPVIGYDRAAEIAKEAFASGRTVRQVCEERSLLPADELARVLDARRMTEPGLPDESD